MSNDDKIQRPKAQPYSVNVDKDEVATTFTEVETIINKLRSDVHKAVADIVEQVILPTQVSVYSIEIPILHLCDIGIPAKGMIAQKPIINIDVSIG